MSLIVREMEIKTTMRYHFTGLNGYHQKKTQKKQKPQNATNNKCWRGCGEK